MGRWLYQDLRRRGFRHLLLGKSITASATRNLKIRRFDEALFYLYHGFVQLPRSMRGLDALLGQIAAFPEGKHDEQVDALSAVAAYFPPCRRKRAGGEGGAAAKIRGSGALRAEGKTDAR